MNFHSVFLIFFAAFLLVIPNGVRSQASDDELLTEIRQLYYGMQEELTSSSIQQFQEQVRYYKRKEDIVFIRLYSSTHTIDNYFLPGRDWPCFSFLYGDDGEYRFYYDSAEDRYQLFTYILPENHPEDYSTRSIEGMARETLILARRAKIEIDNSFIDPASIEQIQRLQDSLLSLQMDTLYVEPFVNPDDPSVPEDIRNELMYGQEASASFQSPDGRITAEYYSSWIDCAGGGSEESSHYSNPSNWNVSWGKSTIADYAEAQENWQYRTIEFLAYQPTSGDHLYGEKLNALEVEFPMHWKTKIPSR